MPILALGADRNSAFAHAAELREEQSRCYCEAQLAAVNANVERAAQALLRVTTLEGEFIVCLQRGLARTGFA